MTATRLSEAVRLGPKVEALVLRGSEPTDLSCVNIMCEKVGEPCVCKLARCVSRLPNLIRLEIPDHKLGFLPEAIGELTSLQYIDVSGTWSPETIATLHCPLTCANRTRERPAGPGRARSPHDT